MKLKNLFKNICFWWYRKRGKRTKKKKSLPTLYDERNNPIMPPMGSRYSKKRHTIQRPTIFTKEETEEILNKQSIKDNESK